MSASSAALAFTRDLVAFPTVSSTSNLQISAHLRDLLEQFGFETEWVEYRDPAGIPKASVVARKGTGSAGMAYFGHTDVVPAETWSAATAGPFDPTLVGDRLYGRGSCDMKGSIGSMLAAIRREAAERDLRRPLYVAFTADEEVGYLGAEQVARRSRLFREMVDGGARGIVGEPTMLQVVHAHKGTYGFRAVSRGRAAHSSTNEGINANLAMIPFLGEMKRIHDETLRDSRWRDPAFDPPGISWNIGINDHTAAVNVTAPRSVCTVYFRPAPGQEPQLLIERSRRAAEDCGVDFELLKAGNPLYADPGSPYVREVLALAGCKAPGTVCYGTDGAVLTDLEKLLVLGPGDIAQAHTQDEWIAVDQLDKGAGLFGRMIRQWCL